MGANRWEASSCVPMPNRRVVQAASRGPLDPKLVAERIIDSKLGQSMSQFCRPGPSSKQIASMRKVIAEDYYRSQSNAPNLQRSSSVVEHRQSSTYPEPAGVYTKATDRCFLPPVDPPHRKLLIPGAQRKGKQRGAGCNGQMA